MKHEKLFEIVCMLIEVMRHKEGDAFMYRKYSSMLCGHYEMKEEFFA